MYLSIDVGGTKTRIDFSADLKNILAHHHFATPKNPEELGTIALNLLKQQKIKIIKGIIIGLPGALNKEKNKLLNCPNLSKPWLKADFKKIFRNVSDNVYCQNDAALAALGEAILGAGRGYNIVAYLTVSTGIGGARIINQKIDASAIGFEPGHHIIAVNGRHCLCGQTGCFEAYASGSAFKDIYQENPKTCTNQKYWNQYAQFLGQGILNAVVFWSPQVLILGGSMFNEPIYFWKPLMKYLKDNLKIVPLPEIKISELKDEAGTLGGLQYLKTAFVNK